MSGKQETKNLANSHIRQAQEALRLHHTKSKQGDLVMCEALLRDVIGHLQAAHTATCLYLSRGGENGKGAEGETAESQQRVSEGPEGSNPTPAASNSEKDSSPDEGQDLDAWQRSLVDFRTHLASEQYQIAELALLMWAGDEWKDLRLADGSYDKYEPLVKWLMEASVDALRDYALKISENVVDEGLFDENSNA